MREYSVQSIYFSPARSTQAVIRAVARGLALTSEEHDITQGIRKPIVFKPGDIAIFGVPSYSGRVPRLATEHLSTLDGKGALAIILTVYGNRDYEDTLLELKEIVTKRGFRVISAAAFVARHSIFPKLAEGRPTVEEFGEAEIFGRESLSNYKELSEISTNRFEVATKGTYPYRPIGAIPLAPKGDSHCTECGTCVASCPTGAIKSEKPRQTEKELCISCARCIELCPENSRRFRGIKYWIGNRQFTSKFAAPKSAEFYYAEAVSSSK